MEFKLSSLAIKTPVTIYLLIILVAFVGMSSYQSLPREDNPDVQFPYLSVSVGYGGTSPIDIETQITNKLEPELQKIDNLKKLTSTSYAGAVSIQMEFELGTNIKEAKTNVREAIDLVKRELPDDASDPIIREYNANDEPILILGISGDIGLLVLKEIAENLEDNLKKVNGVQEIEIHGGLSQEVQVQVDPKKLEYYQVDLNGISNAIRGENINIPGGSMKVGPMNYLVRIPGEITDVDEINEMVIRYQDGSPIFVSDVATVSFTTKEISSYSRLNGLDSVTLDIIKKRGANLSTIAEKVKKVITEEEQKYGKNVHFRIIFDGSIDVKNMVSQLENNIILGILLVVLVLFFFMGGRNALLVGMAIPLSMLMSFTILNWMGITLNTVVLFSLIIALGMLVDNAIVVVENIYRHFDAGLGRTEAAIKGVSEVAIPVISSTITTLLAFLPLVFLPGIMGDFLAYIPKTLIITLTCSLVVGLIFNPVMAATLMKRKGKDQQNLSEVEQVRNSKFLVQYSKVLEWTLRHPFITLLMLLAFWGGIMGYYFTVSNPGGKKSEFFPRGEPRSLKIRVSSPSGTTLETTDAVVKRIEAKIFEFDQYADNISSNSSKKRGSVRVNFPRWEDRRGGFKPSKIIEEIRESIPDISGAKVTLRKAGGGGPGSSQAFQMELTGEDFDALQSFTREIEDAIKDVSGLVNLENSFQSKRDEIRVVIDRLKIAQHGLSTSQVASLIRTAINGRDVSTYRDGQDEYDIVVRLAEKYRRYDEDLKDLKIMTPGGEFVVLAELADIRRAQSMGSIKHSDSKRVISITADASEKASGKEVVSAVKERVKELVVPQGITLSFGGENKDKEELQDQLMQSFWIAVGLIFVVLVTQFNSLALPFIIILSIFASLSGVFLGMIIHDRPLSILIGGIGIVSLAGVVVNNAIVLIDYIRQLRTKGMEVNEAIVLAGMVRLRPVLLTAMTTILGVLPIFLGVDIDFFRDPADIIQLGSEGGVMWYPMNLAMIYGLSVATFLTLFMVPVLYSLNERSKVVVRRLMQRIKPSKPTDEESILKKSA